MELTSNAYFRQYPDHHLQHHRERMTRPSWMRLTFRRRETDRPAS